MALMNLQNSFKIYLISTPSLVENYLLYGSETRTSTIKDHKILGGTNTNHDHDLLRELTTKHSMDWAHNMRNNIWKYCMGVEKNDMNRIHFSLESSRHLAMLTALVSPWNDASDKRAQKWIPYWWRVTTQIWEINKNSSRQQKADTGYRQYFVWFFSGEDYWARYGCQPGHIADTTSRNKLWLRAALKLLKPNNQASGASHWVWRRVNRRAEKQRNTVKAGRNICW